MAKEMTMLGLARSLPAASHTGSRPRSNTTVLTSGAGSGPFEEAVNVGCPLPKSASKLENRSATKAVSIPIAVPPITLQSPEDGDNKRRSLHASSRVCLFNKEEMFGLLRMNLASTAVRRWPYHLATRVRGKKQP